MPGPKTAGPQPAHRHHAPATSDPPDLGDDISNQHLLEQALAFAAQGFSVVPTRPDGTKAPAAYWKQYIARRATVEEISGWLTSGDYDGFGLVMGHVSGDAGMLELEGRAIGLVTEYADLADASGLGDVWKQVTAGYLETTPSGGLHTIYRIGDGPELPNTKLAKDDDGLVLIETRGEGGYVVVAPSAGRTHSTGRPWTLLRGGPADVATITGDERDALHDLARMLDKTPPPAEPPPFQASAHSRADGSVPPGEDYNQRTTWKELLEPLGWQLVYSRGGESYWRRPGKTIGVSATTGRGTLDNLYVFTTSTDFEAERPYSKFGAYTHLQHGGDFTAAARALKADGYGTSGSAPAPRLTVIAGGLTDGSMALAPRPVATTLERSEDGHAHALIEAYGQHIRYCPARGAWLVWNLNVWQWQPKGGGVVREYAKTVARAHDAADPGGLTYKRRALSAAGTTGCLDQARTDPRIVVEIADLDADPWTLNTPAGLVDLRTGQIAPVTPDTLVTRMTVAAPNPAPHEAWDRFLADTFGGDTDLAGYVQRLAGISLIGTVREQVLPFAHGAGANGKSTLLEALMHALRTGETGYATAAPSEMLMIRKHTEHPAELAQLAGARLVVCSELDDGQRFAEARIKQLTGRDSINARFLYGQPFTFHPSHTIWLLGNQRPQARTGGPAFWRRVKLVPFAHTVPEAARNPALGDTLAAAAGHVLAWAIAGAVDYATAGIREPDTVSEATARYASDQDTIGRFVEDRCQLGGGQQVRTPVAAVRAAYEAWCRDVGDQPASPRRLTQELAERFAVGDYRANTRRFYTSVTLLADDTPDEDPEGGPGW